MCLNQSALSCSGTHFIKPSSWGRGSMRPHIYHTNPSGLSPFLHWQHVCDRSPSAWSDNSLTARTYSFPLPSSPFPVNISHLRSSSVSLSPSMMISNSLPSTFVLYFLLSPTFFWRGMQGSEWILNPAVPALFHSIPSCVTALGLSCSDL